MRLKHDVVMSGLKFEMRAAMVVAEKLWAEYGEELVITSALDGTHQANSLHYFGLALDFRTRYFSDDEKLIIEDELRERLKLYQYYDVVLEDDHMHVEWDGPLTNELQ